jgi:hypothetical protein
MPIACFEFKWPGDDQPYLLAHAEHYAQCQQTMWIHEVPLMLYCVFSTRVYTLTPFEYDADYTERWLVPTVTDAYFTLLFPALVEHEERARAGLLGVAPPHAAVPVAAATAVFSSHMIRGRGLTADSVTIACMGARFSWPSSATFADPDAPPAPELSAGAAASAGDPTVKRPRL